VTNKAKATIAVALSQKLELEGKNQVVTTTQITAAARRPAETKKIIGFRKES
jgi:hypothetical protein